MFGSSRDPRRMCPHCRAFITTSDKTCPYCHERVGERAIERRDPSAILGIIPAGSFVTMIILLLNVVLYGATLIASQTGDGIPFDPSGLALYRFGAKYPRMDFSTEWWRLITAGFLHGGVFHILMNSWAMLDLSRQVEELYGSWRLIVFYIVGTIGGFVASTYFSQSLSIGASAGLFGLIGVMIALGLRSKTATGAAIRGMYVRWAIYGLLFGLIPGFRIDNAAHLGGLVAGFAISYLAGIPKDYPTAADRWWRVAGGVTLVVVAVAFWKMSVFLGQPVSPGLE